MSKIGFEEGTKNCYEQSVQGQLRSESEKRVQLKNCSE